MLNLCVGLADLKNLSNESTAFLASAWALPSDIYNVLIYILWLNVNTVITRWRWLDKQKTTQANIAYFSFVVDQTLVSRPEPWSWNLDSKPSFLPTRFTFIVQVLKSKNFKLIQPNAHPFLGLSNSKRIFSMQENYSDGKFTAWNVKILWVGNVSMFWKSRVIQKSIRVEDDWVDKNVKSKFGKMISFLQYL